MTKADKYDLVFASSSRLFTAYLGYKIAKKNKVPFYVDVRDIFYDTMKDILKNSFVRSLTLPFLKMIEKMTFKYATHINMISECFVSYYDSYISGVDKRSWNFAFESVGRVCGCAVFHLHDYYRFISLVSCDGGICRNRNGGLVRFGVFAEV